MQNKTQTRRHHFCAAAAVLLLLCGQAAASSYPTEVLELNDDGFEHDTQAASGQTTGVWAVLFVERGSKKAARAQMVVAELAKDEEKELIYAQVRGCACAQALDLAWPHAPQVVVQVSPPHQPAQQLCAAGYFGGFVGQPCHALAASSPELHPGVVAG